MSTVSSSPHPFCLFDSIPTCQVRNKSKPYPSPPPKSAESPSAPPRRRRQRQRPVALTESHTHVNFSHHVTYSPCPFIYYPHPSSLGSIHPQTPSITSPSPVLSHARRRPQSTSVHVNTVPPKQEGVNRRTHLPLRHNPRSMTRYMGVSRTRAPAGGMNAACVLSRG